ncbi:protein phosphatase [Capronia epimyces CBS 606.96]|uniref:Protein phosphatase n=1 Tax=Capronia epimyces CBS 606.96 TaxID=1182542 RepID=W9XY88_9EURO|nr:protein phosphatase [Capronia epimyces CBS 606.96]EXJ85223.1 protein phosphatase [Capronia epimyces CBS 606.96]
MNVTIGAVDAEKVGKPALIQQPPSDAQKRLALSIIDFLSTSLKDGTLTSDDADNIEVATNCIAEAFKVDPNDKAAISAAVGSQSLLSVFSVYEKLKGTGTSAETPLPKPSELSAINPEAEKLKSAGNAAMQQKDYKTAIAKYTEAIKYAPTNPIYLSNRAAAYSATGDHTSAVQDAELAVAADPKYTKAWSRLGLARFALGDAKGSVEAYEKGIEFEGSGGSEAMKKGLETAKKELARMEAAEDDIPEDEVDDAPGNTRGGGGLPDLSGLASMLGGGAGGGGGGMPDLSSIMNNPMFASMAQNLMRNPEALSGLMSNPTIQNMMQGRREGGGGGGLPDMSQIQQMMQDPALANL